MLGFPPEARLLLVNCDDFGMYPAINAAVIASLDTGIARSCSVMVPCPGAPGALRLLAARPGLSFGVHLTLVCELGGPGSWGPVADRTRVPSLLDEKGRLYAPTPAGRALLLARARTEEVEREFRAQLAVVDRAGLAPTHLDFHCLADGGRPDILDVAVSLAAERGLAVRVWGDEARKVARGRGLPVVDHPFLDSFSLDLVTKREHYARLLRELPAGLSEWAVHPGLDEAAARAVDDGWRVRSSDHAFLTSSYARELLDEEGVVVVDYRALQGVWAARNGGG